MKEREKTLKVKVGNFFNSTHRRLEGMRDPLDAETSYKFMDLVDKKRGNRVTLTPQCLKDGFYRDREKRNDEYIGGMNEPTWVHEFVLTGYVYNTLWESCTSSNRRLMLRVVHEKVDIGWYRPQWEINNARQKAEERNFNQTLEDAEREHRKFPGLKFLVDGEDGLRDYRYYLKKLKE